MGDFYKKYIVTVLIISTLFSGFFFLPAKRADAGWGAADTVIEVGPNLIEDTYNAVVNTKNWFKDFVLDTIAWIVAKMAIREITDNTVSWINSGFKGNPTFVTNPGSYFKDLANQASGAFINKLGAEDLLCGEFKAEVIGKLKYSYQAAPMQKFQCTLNDAVNNWSDFMNDFSAGGWEGWLAITTQPQNNPYGAYIMGVDEMNAEVNAKVSVGKQELKWGSGFMSLKECADSSADKSDFCQLQCGDAGSDYDSCVSNCNETDIPEDTICEGTGGQVQNTTPGKIIESRLSDVLGQDVRTLGVADEFDEIISALINQLLTNLLGGGSGLSGGSTYDSVGNSDTLSGPLVDQIDSSIGKLKKDSCPDVVKKLEDLKTKAEAITDTSSEEYTNILNEYMDITTGSDYMNCATEKNKCDYSGSGGGASCALAGAGNDIWSVPESDVGWEYFYGDMLLDGDNIYLAVIERLGNSSRVRLLESSDSGKNWKGKSGVIVSGTNNWSESARVRKYGGNLYVGVSGISSGGKNNHIFVSKDGGSGWEELNLPDKFGFLSPFDFVVTGDGSFVLAGNDTGKSLLSGRTTDNGADWSISVLDSFVGANGDLSCDTTGIRRRWRGVQLQKGADGKIFVIYERAAALPLACATSYEIKLMSSTNNGASWSGARTLTRGFNASPEGVTSDTEDPSNPGYYTSNYITIPGSSYNLYANGGSYIVGYSRNGYAGSEQPWDVMSIINKGKDKVIETYEKVASALGLYEPLVGDSGSVGGSYPYKNSFAASKNGKYLAYIFRGRMRHKVGAQGKDPSDTGAILLYSVDSGKKWYFIILPQFSGQSALFRISDSGKIFIVYPSQSNSTVDEDKIGFISGKLGTYNGDSALLNNEIFQNDCVSADGGNSGGGGNSSGSGCGSDDTTGSGGGGGKGDTSGTELSIYPAVKNASIAPGEKKEFYLIIPGDATILDVEMTSNDWDSNADMVVSKKAYPTWDDYNRYKDAGTQLSRSPDSDFWFVFAYDSNESVKPEKGTTFKKGDYIYITVFNDDMGKRNASVGLYWYSK